MAAHPVDHGVALDRVLRVVDIVAAEPAIDDKAVVARLVSEGVGPVDAELLIRFVPSAMSFGLLKQLGVATFPSTYLLRAESGRWVERPLAAEHYFTAAIQLGFDIVTHGYTERVGREAFQAIILRSAELGAANDALKSGNEGGLAGATLDPPTLLGITAEQVTASRPAAPRPWWRFWERGSDSDSGLGAESR